MRRALLSAVAAGFAAAALLVTGIAAAAVSPVYSTTGFLTGASANQASFFGTGTGSGGDRLMWGATFVHTGLPTASSASAEITGGELAATSMGRGGAGPLDGTVMGGTVTYNAELSSSAVCGNQVYDVEATVALEGFEGTFSLRVTEHRLRLFGTRCLSLTASVTGVPGLTLTPTVSGPEF
jgi:hypothetical protein